jgi:hypothetical protein
VEMVASMMLGIGSALGLRFGIFVLLPVILLGLFVCRFRARSGYNDLVDHAHECYRRDVLADRIFGRRLAQISDLYRTI